jgi:hypothetical protein
MEVLQELKSLTDLTPGIQQMMKKHTSKEKESFQEHLLHLKLLHLDVF